MIQLMKRVLKYADNPIKKAGTLRGLQLQIGMPFFLLITLNPREKAKQYRMVLKAQQIINVQFQKVIQSIKPQTVFLTELRLTYVGINDQTLLVIQKAGWKFIKVAKFSKNNITWKGVKHLGRCEWKYLNLLQLCNNPIKNKGIEVLCKTDWPNLRHLHLTACQIDDHSLNVLRKGLIDQLVSLSLSQNYLTHNCLKILATADLKRLISFDLRTHQFPQGLLKTFYSYAYKLPYSDDKYRTIHGSQFFCQYYTKKLQRMMGRHFQ